MAFPDTGSELHGLIEPVDNNEKYRETMEFVENVLRPQTIHRWEFTNRRYFGEEGKPRSRRNMIYCHDWGVNAGHDLNLQNLGKFCSIPGVLEVSIGHALIGEALEMGLANTVKAYLEILAKT